MTKKERKDLGVLALFTSVYCRAHHKGDKRAPDISEIGKPGMRLCDECNDFLSYAFVRRLKCPLDPKPDCKGCQIHCYRKGHRDKVREIMRFSGKRLILRGRFDLLWHYFF